MKISNINNNYSFKGIDYSSFTDKGAIKKIIMPHLQDLKNLAKNVDVTLKPDTFLQTAKHYQSPRPAISIKITSKDQTQYNTPEINSKMLIEDYETAGEELFDTVKTFVRNFFY